MAMRIAVFGDSIVRGIVPADVMNASERVRYAVSPDGFVGRCAARLGVRMDNFGKFGSTVRHGLSAVNRNLDALRLCDYAILEYGGNDCDFRWSDIGDNPDAAHMPNTPIGEFSQCYSNLIDIVRSCGATPLMLTLPPLVPERYFGTFCRDMSAERRSNVMRWLGGSVETISNWHEMYNLELFKTSVRMGVPLIDITTGFLLRRDWRDLMCCDGIHPNSDGHAVIAAGVCGFFERMMRDKRGWK